MSKTPPYDPDETAEQLAAALRRNHPELSDTQIEALLTGEPKRRQSHSGQAKAGWRAGVKGPEARQGGVPGAYPALQRRTRG